MEKSRKRERVYSHMFTLQVWVEDVGNDRFEIRGQIKHVLTGETIYFREWSSLLGFLQNKLETDKGSVETIP